MKRLTRVLVCAALMASSLIMPVGAWDKYSFVGDDVYFSGQDAVLRPPPVLAESAASTSTVSGFDFLSLLNPSFSSLAGMIEVYHESEVTAGITVPAWTEYRSVPSSGTSFSRILSSPDSSYPSVRWQTSSFDFEQNLNNGEFQGILGIVTEPYSLSTPNLSFSFEVDLSNLGEFTAFELYGGFNFRGAINNNSNYLFNSSSVDLYVNGALMRTFYKNTSGTYNNNFYVDHYIYSGSSPVSSIVFTCHLDSRSFDVSSGNLNLVFIENASWPQLLSISTLSGNSILDGNIDDAQDQINDWDSIESQFGDDATEGFNGLDLDNFTYPSDFLAAFSLVSGIFTDLWNCMGDFQIIYLLPLTLGICLLLVGRVSRSSVPSPPPLHTDLPVSNSLGPPSRPALKGGKR